MGRPQTGKDCPLFYCLPSKGVTYALVFLVCIMCLLVAESIIDIVTTVRNGCTLGCHSFSRDVSGVALKSR